MGAERWSRRNRLLESLQEAIEKQTYGRLRDSQTDEVDTYTLVFPEEANISQGKLSILAPIGTAILGYQVGDEVRWRVPSGWRHVQVEEVLYQPEREGAT